LRCRASGRQASAGRRASGYPTRFHPPLPRRQRSTANPPSAKLNKISVLGSGTAAAARTITWPFAEYKIAIRRGQRHPFVGQKSIRQGERGDPDCQGLEIDVDEDAARDQPIPGDQTR